MSYVTPDGRSCRQPDTIHCARCQSRDVSPVIDPIFGLQHGYSCNAGCEQAEGCGHDGAPYTFDPSMCECDECWPLASSPPNVPLPISQPTRS